MNERQVPPAFEYGNQRTVFLYSRQRTIEFPVTPGEIEPFPRSFSLAQIEEYRMNFRKRRTAYRAQLSMIARNCRRDGRGGHVFIILPDTARNLLEVIRQEPGSHSSEAARIVEAMYFRGLSPEEAQSQVSRRTLGRYLRKAEDVVDLLGDLRDKPFKIGLKTVSVSYLILRLGRDGLIDIEKYFRGRIF